MLTELPLDLGFNEHETTFYASQIAQNCYPEPAQGASMADNILLPTPGIDSVATTVSISSYANRGSGRLNDIPYFVQGPTLYRLNSDETVTSIGSISGSGRVYMDENGSQLMILVPGGNGYIYDGTTLTQITDIDFDQANGKPIAMVFIDGYFVCVTDTGKVTCCNLNDGLTWNALDVGTAESDPDGLVAPFVYRNQLHVAGSRTIEQFTNVGGAAFPFQRTNLFYDRGLSAGQAWVNFGDAVIFYGAGENERPAIWMIKDGETVKVSNFALDRKLRALTAAQEAAVFAWSYMEDGHHFAVFVLPDEAYVYDAATDKWHTRVSRVDGDNDQIIDSRCRVNSCISAYGALYVGDQYDGRIGKLSSGTDTEYGNAMIRRFSTQPYHMNRSPFSVPYLEVGIEAGQGAEVEMEVSIDGGKTWRDPRKRSMGVIGDWPRRCAWRRLGRFRDTAVFRFTTSSAARTAFFGVFAEIVQ